MCVIAQASLVERILVELGAANNDFSEWSNLGRDQLFFLQSLVDLRHEPRWVPDFVDPGQLKLEFLCRACNAAVTFRDKIPPGDLRTICLDDGPDGIASLLPFPQAYLRGPREGGLASPTDIPDEFVKGLNSVREGQVLEANAFAGTVNSAYVFRLEKKYVQLAVDALQKSKYRVNLDGEGHLSFSLLVGLAAVAAVTRTPELAEEIRLLSRVVRQRQGSGIEPDAHMRVALIGSADNEDLPAWCDAVGMWFADIRTYL